MLSALRTLLRDRRLSSRRPLRFRPVVEGLESREVPSVNVWTNMTGNGQASTSANWSLFHVPGSGVGANDTVQFGGGGQASNSDCYGLSGSVFQVQMLGPADIGNSPYTKTVTFTTAGTMYSLLLHSGNVVQTGVDLSVSTGFDWTAGTLNATGSGTTFHILPSATANISPGALGLVTGDTLSFEVNANQGAQGTINPGTVQFNNAAGIVVGGTGFISAYATLTTQGNVSTLRPNGTGLITAKPGGRVMFNGPGIYNDELPITNQGGEVWVYGGVTANVTGQLAPGAASLQQDSGTTYIQAGSILAPKWGIYFGGDKLSTLANADGGSQVAIIGCPFATVTDAGADVVINDSGNPTNHVPGTLRCSGDVNWTGGTYRPVVNGATKTSDLWLSAGKFTVGAGAALAPGTINAGNIAPTDIFLFLQGDGTIVGNPPTPSGGVSYTVVVQGSPAIKWYFKKV